MTFGELLMQSSWRSGFEYVFYYLIEAQSDRTDWLYLTFGFQ
tara:strand:- start:1234 stop:1359 length:126 start_codon:yes stop_codon:yes gene_type:complete